MEEGIYEDMNNVEGTYEIPMEMTNIEDTYEIPTEVNNVEGTYEIPMKRNKDEGTYEIPTEMNNVDRIYEIPMNISTVESEVPVGTNQTYSRKKITVIITFLILIVIIVGVSLGTYSAGKLNDEGKDDVNVFPNVAVTTAVSKVTSGSTQAINTATFTPECPSITCPTPKFPSITGHPTPASSSSTSPTPVSTSITSPTPASTRSTSTTPATRCINGWVYHRGSYYCFGKYPYKSFSEAVSFCHRLNAKLIEVGSKSENEFVKGYLSKLKYPSLAYWMGLTDVTTEGTFLLYSSGRPASFFDWAYDEPNNELNEDCVSFSNHGYFNFRWNDIPCNSYNFIPHPICEL